MDEQRREAIQQLRNASPLEATRILQQMELYDQKSSQSVIDEVYEQFASGQNMENEILSPIFMAIIDGILEAMPSGRAARKKGLTASRVVRECKVFTYDGEQDNGTHINAYTEYKNSTYNQKKSEAEYDEALKQWRKETTEWGRTKQGPKPEKPEYTGDKNSRMTQDYKRNNYHDTKSMENYKADAAEEESAMQDEYTGKNDLHYKKNSIQNNYNDDKNAKLAETDHIVPLKQIHEAFKHNYALDDADIKEIANSDFNFAITAAEINDGRGKGASTNEEYIKRMKDKGTPVDKETEENMLMFQKSAESEINFKANEMIINNFISRVDEDAINKKYKELYDRKIKAYVEKHGEEPSEQKQQNMRKAVEDKKQKEIEEKTASQKQKGNEIRGKAVKNAASQSKDYAIGNLILFIVKPLYYEMADILKNGLQKGVNANSGMEGIKIRFGRIKNHVLTHAKGFLGDNLWEFIKGFVSSLLEGIISLFVGVFKQILKLIKEGIKIFVQSAKILFGKDSKSMSPAEKGDAIIKLIGGSVIAISGIGIESLINKVGIGEPWSVVLSTTFSGIASALFMYILDKADIFSVKAEKRRNRIIEIFDERIKDINEAAETCNVVAIETFKRQREQFEEINNGIDKGIKDNNIISINEGLYKMADFMKVDLPYSNTDEFCDYMDSEDLISL